ncbi:MAG: protein-L-isoaspartate(D-aspartate) O-methyltransferase [Pseudomonadota bacterium]
MRTWITALLVLLLAFHPGGAEASDENEYLAGRLMMVAKQIKARGVTDKGVLAAMGKVRRHMFVPDEIKDLAYEDRPWPIGYGQTISQPYIVAYMTEVLKLTGREKVLEIGTGSGYQAAILAETAAAVYSIEIIPELYESAQKRLNQLGYKDIKLRAGDGYYGWPGEEDFDGIIVTCAADHIPPPLIKQLKVGGRLVIPVGPAWAVQTLMLVEKKPNGEVSRQGLMQVRFVPLIRE